MHPAKYWRHTQTHKEWLGKKGVVIASSLVHVAAPTQSALTPYSYALVDFGNTKHEWMGADTTVLAAGDKVICVLRKTGNDTNHGLIPYGIKVKKIDNDSKKP